LIRLRHRSRGALLSVALAVGCASGSATPGDVLDEQAFWSLVAQTGGGHVEDRAAVLTHLLATAKAPRLESWQQQLVVRVGELNTTALSEAMTVVCGKQDTYGFAADRSWLVAHGQQAFATARDHPDELASLPDLASACDGSGEAFADVATTRYSDLGFEPGGDAFPAIELSPPHGPVSSYPRLRARFT
jgi:hypothetical protein